MRSYLTWTSVSAHDADAAIKRIQSLRWTTARDTWRRAYHLERRLRRAYHRYWTPRIYTGYIGSVYGVKIITSDMIPYRRPRRYRPERLAWKYSRRLPE